MDFKRLPNHVGVKILHDLPIKNQVRVARVSRRFEELSTMAISMMTEIDLSDEMFKTANLEKLIRLCSGSLEKMTVSYWYSGLATEDAPIRKKRIELASQLPHPRLIELKLKCLFIEAETMRQLFANCPNLRHLNCDWEVGEFRSRLDDNSLSVTCKNVEKLTFHDCSSQAIESYIDICPRLKNLSISKRRGPNPDQRLNKILSKCLGIEQLQLSIYDRFYPIRLGSLDNLWRLSSLRSFSMSIYFIVDEQAAMNILNRLGQLEYLSISISDTPENGLSSWKVIPPISRLKNLRQFEFNWKVFYGLDVDDPLWMDRSIYHLTGHQRLERIKLNFDLSSATVIAFAHNCPQLKLLIIWGIDGIDSNTKAKQFVQRLRGFVQSNLTIALFCRDEAIWRSKTVQYALSRVNAAAPGRSITIEVNNPWNFSHSYPFSSDL